MKLTYLPANKLTRAASASKGGVLMVHGGTYEVEQAYADALVKRIPGDGGPCLVPVKAEAPAAEPAPAPKAETPAKASKTAKSDPAPGETET